MHWYKTAFFYRTLLFIMYTFVVHIFCIQSLFAQSIDSINQILSQDTLTLDTLQSINETLSKKEMKMLTKFIY